MRDREPGIILGPQRVPKQLLLRNLTGAGYVGYNVESWNSYIPSLCMGHLMGSKTVSEEAWIKVLGKGMITLPKKWRDAMGIEQGDVVKAKKEGDKVVLEPSTQKGAAVAPYRIFRANEINEFLEEDLVSEELIKQAEKKLFPHV